MDELVGAWRKSGGDAGTSVYPDELELRPAGRYTGRNGAPAKEHPWWDVGGWRVVSADRMAISTFTDRVVEYRYTLEGDELSFTDPEGRHFGYRRADAQPSA
jgi:hypothetical protein